VTDPWPWSPGSATGIGSLPGVDIVEAVKTVLGEAPDLPYLPELPARGPGADMIGRSAGLLVDLPVELYAAQWRIASHAGRDLRRTADLWERDVDALTEAAAGFDGPLKLQIAGPWTLAASIDLPIGGRLLRDPGAVRDLAASLAEGLAAHVADVRARLPLARVLVQIDEPSLPAVLAGHVPTESGYGTLRTVDASVARSTLTDVVTAANAPVVLHCCAADAPLDLFRDAGAVAVAIDLDRLDVGRAGALDPLGEVLDVGLGLFAGAISTDNNASVPTSAAVADRIANLWRTLGFATDDLARQVVVTPACGLAAVTEERARAVMTVGREAAKRLADS
jgi:methionine synthase II (cobalamin-independent)